MSQSGQPGGTPPAPPPQAPPPPSWQSTPQPPSPPAGGPSTQQMPAWANAIMDRTPVAGPAGFYYADVPNRIIAYIIDYIIYFIAYFILGAITLAILGDNVAGFSFQTTASVFVQQVLAFAAAGAYFVYTWVYMRGTVGMRLLGMQIGNERDGSTLTMNAAIIRFSLLFGPGFVAGLLYAVSLGLGFLTSLVSLVWFIALLYTTAMSPTKQGLHDRYAHTMVVKAARSVA
jgi:uncharacterized RDD family membrane protein YckC